MDLKKRKSDNTFQFFTINKNNFTGSRPSYASQLKRGIQNRTEEGFKLFVATVYGEACGQSEVAWQVVASSIVNRVNNKFFRVGSRHHKHRLNTPEEVIVQPCWYEAYYKNRANFRIAFDYLTGRVVKKPLCIDKLTEIIRPIYYERKVTTDADHYYSPKAQRAGYKKGQYKSPVPDWVVTGLDENSLQEIVISGLGGEDDFKFYKRIK